MRSGATAERPRYTADELMTVAAARALQRRHRLLRGHRPAVSTAANLARLTHAPGPCSSTSPARSASKPATLPLSIGDGELAETADSVVSVPEIFNYWLQGGRIDVGFLGAAQIDRFGNLNSTVIGDYERTEGAPARRRRRARDRGAAPSEVIVIIRQSPKSFVERLDFRSSVGPPAGGDHRPGRAAPRPEGRRADAGADPSRRDRRAGARGHGLGPARGRRPGGDRGPDRGGAGRAPRAHGDARVDRYRAVPRGM